MREEEKKNDKRAEKDHFVKNVESGLDTFLRSNQHTNVDKPSWWQPRRTKRFYNNVIIPILATGINYRDKGFSDHSHDSKAKDQKGTMIKTSTKTPVSMEVKI